jgi:O-acetyl-ADP-ribose deacetylase (regulator of RNase III)
MISYTQGNLLDARVDALVNTVNTVGVMGKGIALMFKERYDHNFKLYAAACKAGEVKLGQMFVTETGEFDGPRWIINFPTKDHWKGNSRLEWVDAGLLDLKRVLHERNIRSVAIPPLGAGNGGLDWSTVKARINTALADLGGVEVIVYEPTRQYLNVSKRAGVQKLTPARALLAEAVRRYWVLGMECSLQRSRSSRFISLPLALRGSGSAHQVKRLGHLVVGQPRGAVGAQRGASSSRGAPAGVHEGMHPLAQHRAGAADDGRLHHAGPGHQHVLDLDRIDLVAAAVEHVLLAVEHAHIALGVDRAQVARMPVAGGERRRRGLGLAQ